MTKLIAFYANHSGNSEKGSFIGNENTQKTAKAAPHLGKVR